MNIHTKKRGGYVIVISMVFLAIFFVVSTAMINTATQYNRSENVWAASAQALALAEAGIDKAITQLNQSQSYTGESNTTFGNGQFTVEVASAGSNMKTITATGYVPNSSNPLSVRTVRVTAGIGTSVISFRYGIQVGNGGFIMNGGSVVNGSIYSNGSIVATNGVTITGAAVAANPPSLTADQSNETPETISTCGSGTCITFGNSNSTEDVAQSFRISSAVALNNIQFYIKKVSTPGNITVRIMTDSSGSPSGTTLMTGTLSAAAVTSNFGWVTVTMPSTPILDPSQTYWMVLDGSSNTNRYYILGANPNSYSNGVAKIGRVGSTWSDTSPSNLDGYFKIFLGGGTSTIGGDNYVGGVLIGTTADDVAWAQHVQGASVTGTIYCQTGSSNNKACNTSRGTPDPQPMPLSDSNIQEWKDDAAAGGTISGNVTVGSEGATLGPKRITGNLAINGGGILTVSGTLWVEGTVSVEGGGLVKLDSTYGSNSGMIVSDGIVSISGGGNFQGSGETGSYPFLITTSACPTASGCGGLSAITLSGGAGTVALIAQNGNVLINGGSALKQVTGKQVTMSGGATLQYDSGLISENFSSGPGGSWEFVPGTYVIVR